MKIGDIDLGPRPVMLAPMEDVTDPSFRLICKEMGADFVYTEFVSAEALVRNVPSTARKLAIADAERPAAIQIYGRDPEPMAEAAKMAEAAGADVIDINFGCPVKKVAGKGAGAGLLRDVPKMLSITRAVVGAVSKPVTVKTRLGWDCNSKIIVELSEMLQDCGIAALTVHGRTRSQMYTGEADWDAIGEVKANPRLTIPVIGNGDIDTPQKVEAAFATYGVDGVMVGRAAIGNPWIFRSLKGLPDLTLHQKFELLRRQISESIDRIDQYRGILHIRRHLAVCRLFKAIPNFRDTRIAMLQADNKEKLFSIIDSVEQMLSSTPTTAP